MVSSLRQEYRKHVDVSRLLFLIISLHSIWEHTHASANYQLLRSENKKVFHEGSVFFFFFFLRQIEHGSSCVGHTLEFLIPKNYLNKIFSDNSNKTTHCA